MTTAATAPARPVLQRAADVQVIGELAGSGYRVPPSLARRSDGQTIQLTPLLLAILRAIDGQRTPEEIASTVSDSTGRTVNADNVETLVEGQLRPLGLLRCDDGSEPVVRKRNPLLGLRFRYAITDPERTRRITGPFQFLFRAAVAVPMLAAFVAVCWWVFLRKGLASATWDAFERPGLLILVFVITVLSAGFHEFGHAAAARYGGADPGVMGFGVYLVWPAFYTDVTDSYRLSKWGRLRTDLGGLYFNAIVAVVITGLWTVLRYDALLLVVATQILQMLRQLAPMVRFDGYHVVADITGVPDLYSRIKPTLLGALPWRWGDPEAALLKRWARVVVTAWVLIVVPLLASLLLGAVLALPRLIGTAWLSLEKQQKVLTSALAHGDMLQSAARVLAMIAIVIPVAGTLYLFGRLLRRTAATVWIGSAGRPLMRALTLVCGALVLSGLAWAWWPREGNYLPIRPTEHGAFFNIELMPSVHRMSSANTSHRITNSAAHSSPVLRNGSQGVMRVLWDTRSAPPTKKSPQLALVLVPRPAAAGAVVGTGGGGGAVAAPAAAQTARGWVFPFSKPIAPGPGDNQALAVNTTDGTIVYDTAFAMIWMTDNSYAQNRNDGEAYASCRTCAAVAVAYQVVFVVDSNPNDDNVATPQNLAGALNYNCVNCMTYGLARQLFVTLNKPLSPLAMAQLTVLWAEITAYGYEVRAGLVPLNQIDPKLADYTRQILAIVQTDQPGALSPMTMPTSTSAATSMSNTPVLSSAASTSGSATASTTSASPSAAAAAPVTVAPRRPTAGSAPPTSASPTTAGTAEAIPTSAQTPSATTNSSQTTAASQPVPTGTDSAGTASPGTP